jgi:hypothetical protein
MQDIRGVQASLCSSAVPPLLDRQAMRSFLPIWTSTTDADSEVIDTGAAARTVEEEGQQGTGQQERGQQEG